MSEIGVIFSLIDKERGSLINGILTGHLTIHFLIKIEYKKIYEIY